MNIEETIFNKYIIDKDKLLEYGFTNINNKLIYKKSILDNSFDVIIEYDKTIKGKIIDKEFNEEYTNYRLNDLGEFSSNIKQEFINILTDIRNKCSKKELFKYNQAKRINDYIYEKYNTKPEFLWESYPSFCIYRVGKKWFGLIGNVQRSKIDLKDNNEEVEILNIKVDDISKYKNLKGYYNGYHMNKKYWISIILDDTLKDSEIQKLIDRSYEIVR